MAKKPTRRRTKKQRPGFFQINKRWLLILLLAGLSVVVLVVLARWSEEPAPSAPVVKTPPVQDVIPQARLEVEAFLARTRLASRDIQRDVSTIPNRYQVKGALPPADQLAELAASLQKISPSLNVTASTSNELLIMRSGQAQIVVSFAPIAPEPPSGPLVAIIMDDMGRGTYPAKVLLSLPQPVTFAILPGESHALDVARMGHDGGREIMLHVPMEPQGYPAVNPGDDALLLRYDDAEIRRRFVAFLEKIPHVIGANNHMGSRFTEDRQAMGVVMDVMHEKGLFFVDSLTTGRSQAGAVAEEQQVPHLKRDVFLDNVAEVGAIKMQIEQLAKRARQKGYALGLCHPYPETLEALRQSLPGLSGQGVEVVPVSQLLSRAAAAKL